MGACLFFFFIDSAVKELAFSGFVLVAGLPVLLSDFFWIDMVLSFLRVARERTAEFRSNTPGTVRPQLPTDPKLRRSNKTREDGTRLRIPFVNPSTRLPIPFGSFPFRQRDSLSR